MPIKEPTKMIAGTTWKAKMKGNCSEPARGPNRKPAPCLEKSRICVTPWPSAWKSRLPQSVLRMKKARASWKPRPHRTTRGLMALRLVDRAKAMPRMATMPASPMKRSMILRLTFLKRPARRSWRWCP
ncbi:hypothetical protein D3C72_1638560 [compost metagenome]